MTNRQFTLLMRHLTIIIGLQALIAGLLLGGGR